MSRPPKSRRLQVESLEIRTVLDAGPLLNEIVWAHGGNDTREFVEVTGPASTDLSRYWVLSIEGDRLQNPGRIDNAFRLGTTDALGYWSTPYLNNELENGSQTFLLVKDFRGDVGDDLDLLNRGQLRTNRLGTIVDAVAFRNNYIDIAYTNVVLTNGFFNFINPVGGLSRIPERQDQNSIHDWVRNDYDGAGLQGLTGTPEQGEAWSTRGNQNRRVGDNFTLTVFHNNDGESKLRPRDAGAASGFGGVANFATLLDQLRQSDPSNANILLSSGDNFLAGPEFDASLSDGVFYDALALNLLGYDALAIGNHEFDFGPDVLADFLRDTDGSAPFLSANLDFSGEPELQDLVEEGRIAPYTVVYAGGERIGIVGATTPDIPFISSPGNVRIIDANNDGARDINDVILKIQDAVDDLEAQGVNKIILISHLQNLANEETVVLPQLRGVDVVIAGGGDETMANPGTLVVPGDAVERPVYPVIGADSTGRSVPIITTSGEYLYVGRLLTEFDGAGHLVSASGDPVRVNGNAGQADSVTADPEVQAEVVTPVNEHVAALAANVIGTSEVSLDGRNPNPIRLTESNLGNLMTDSLTWQAQQSFTGIDPTRLVGLQNGGGIRNNSVIPPGNITELNTFQIAAFDNFLAIVRNVTPTKVKELMEHAYSSLPAANGRFGHIAGMSVVVDDALPVGSRIVSITLDDGTKLVDLGAVVAGAPSVTVATINFLARGGDGYPFGGLPFETDPVTYQQSLLAYISTGLGGVIRAADYPEGGEGRIVIQ